MSVLRAIESKIEGLFEGVFGRAFRTNVQPIELARWLTKEMDEHRSVSVSRVYVPNEYTVYLAPSDRAQFASYEGSLIGELQEYLAEHARREGYALLTPPQVMLRDGCRPRDGRVRGLGARSSSRPRESSRSGAAARRRPRVAVPGPVAAVRARRARRRSLPAATMVYRPEEPPGGHRPEPEPPREQVDARRSRAATSRSRATASSLGRSRECDIRLDDANVSRRHAEVGPEDGTYWRSSTSARRTEPS